MKKGDYVLATKWNDGDPGDEYCVGFYDSMFGERYIVVDNSNKPFRANGFRRCECITPDEGNWLIQHFADFTPFELARDSDGYELTDHDGNEILYGWSVWDWLMYYRNGRKF